MRRLVLPVVMILTALLLRSMDQSADTSGETCRNYLCIEKGDEVLADLWPEFSMLQTQDRLEYSVTAENRYRQADYVNVSLLAVPKESAPEEIREMFDMPYKDRLDQVNELQVKASMAQDKELSAQYYEEWYSIIQDPDPLRILYGAGEPVYEQAGLLTGFLDRCKIQVSMLPAEGSFSKAGNIGAPCKRSCGRVNPGEKREIRIVMELPEIISAEERLLMEGMQWNLCVEERYEHPLFDIGISAANEPENGLYYQEGETVGLNVELVNKGNGRLSRIVYDSRGFEGEEYGARGVYDSERGTMGKSNYTVTAEEAEKGLFAVKLRCWAAFDNPDLDYVYVEKEVDLPAGKKQGQQAAETEGTVTALPETPNEEGVADSVKEVPLLIIICGAGILAAGSIAAVVLHRRKKEHSCRER